jgi:hypothetical protein
VTEDTKDTWRSQDSCCLANFPGAERPFIFLVLMELFQLTPESSGSVPSSGNCCKKQH